MLMDSIVPLCWILLPILIGIAVAMFIRRVWLAYLIGLIFLVVVGGGAGVGSLLLTRHAAYVEWQAEDARALELIETGQIIDQWKSGATEESFMVVPREGGDPIVVNRSPFFYDTMEKGRILIVPFGPIWFVVVGCIAMTGFVGMRALRAKVQGERHAS